MKLLLDTHIFLWYSQDSPNLPVNLREAIRNKQNEIFISIVSLWEIAIKMRVGKLILDSLENMVDEVLDKDFKIQMVRPEHVYLAKELPLHHRDPFDRMIIAQGIVDEMTIASCDVHFPKYNVSLILSTP